MRGNDINGLGGREKRRFFISLKVPDEILRACVAFQKKASRIAKEEGISVRWTAPNQIHLTLIFLGWTNSMLQDQVTEAIYNTSSESEPFEIKMTEVGVYPGMQAPRILWAGLSKEVGLMTLQEKLAYRLAALDFPLEKRPYQPHLTLGRVKDASGFKRFFQWMVQEGGLYPETGLMKQMALMESHTDAAGSIYIPLFTSVLGEKKRN